MNAAQSCALSNQYSVPMRVLLCCAAMIEVESRTVGDRHGSTVCCLTAGRPALLSRRIRILQRSNGHAIHAITVYTCTTRTHHRSGQHLGIIDVSHCDIASQEWREIGTLPQMHTHGTTHGGGHLSSVSTVLYVKLLQYHCI